MHSFRIIKSHVCLFQNTYGFCDVIQPHFTHRKEIKKNKNWVQDIWDSEEDEENNDKIMSEINGSVEMHVEPTQPPKKVETF